MKIDDINVMRRDLRLGDCGLHAFNLSLSIREHKINGVGIDMITGDFSVNFRTPFQGIFESFQNKNGATFGNDNAVAIHIQGAACFCGIFVETQRALALETGKNSECSGTFRDASC